MSDREILKKRVLAHLQTIAPRSSTKEKMRSKLLIDLDLDGTDLQSVMLELRQERWIWNTFENYFFISEERIAEQELKNPTYRLEVESHRNGEVPKKTSSIKQPPITNSWCKYIIKDEEYRQETINYFKAHHEVFRLLSRIMFDNYTLPAAIDPRPIDEEEVKLYHNKLMAYLEWADPKE